jgi:hypothetical protein
MEHWRQTGCSKQHAETGPHARQSIAKLLTPVRIAGDAAGLRGVGGLAGVR